MSININFFNKVYVNEEKGWDDIRKTMQIVFWIEATLAERKSGRYWSGVEALNLVKYRLTFFSRRWFVPAILDTLACLLANVNTAGFDFSDENKF